MITTIKTNIPKRKILLVETAVIFRRLRMKRIPTARNVIVGGQQITHKSANPE